MSTPGLEYLRDVATLHTGKRVE